ncbi:ABC transporter permease [bacterium]|nr:ABC transporter permease [bacterium]
MNLAESIGAGLRDMGANKSRAAITMVGIVLGVASVVTVLSLMEGGRAQTEAYFEELGGLRELRITNRRTNRVFMSASERASERLTYRDAKAIRFECPSVSYVDPEISRHLTVSYLDKSFQMRVLGTTADYVFADDMPVAEGRFITDRDLDTYANVIMMGPTYKEDFFGDDEAIGKTVLVEGVPFTVVGVMEKKEFFFRGGGGERNVLEWFNRGHYIPITTMIKRFAITDQLGGLEIAAKSVDLIPSLMDEARTVLTRRHGVEDFDIESKSEQVRQQMEQGAFFNVVFWAVAFVSLFVGGVVVADIMLSSITERIREIGVRKAIGASSRDVFIEFVVEALVITSLGGAVGLAVGYGLVRAMESALIMPMAFSPPILLIAFMTSVTVGIVFGIFPALRAARLDPVEALRYE